MEWMTLPMQVSEEKWWGLTPDFKGQIEGEVTWNEMEKEGLGNIDANSCFTGGNRKDHFKEQVLSLRELVNSGWKNVQSIWTAGDPWGTYVRVISLRQKPNNSELKVTGLNCSSNSYRKHKPSSTNSDFGTKPALAPLSSKEVLWLVFQITGQDATSQWREEKETEE